MKKRAAFFILIFTVLFSSFSQEQFGIIQKSNYGSQLPALLKGIWQGTDRLVLFSDDSELAIVLRVFYQWYNDRSAEPSKFNEIKIRDRNDTVSKMPENISVKFRTVSENDSKTAGVYELEFKYPENNDLFYIPICVIDGKIYLDFLVKGENSEDASEKNGYWRAASNADGITVSPPRYSKELLSYYFKDNTVYSIRYWLSDMEFSSVKAEFTDGNSSYSVDKFIKIAETVYQCTTGRSSKIRNVNKSFDFNRKFKMDSENKYMVFGSEYLMKVPAKESPEDFLVSVEENNLRKKPAPKPLFPVSEIDFHWKDISELEKYNPYTWNRRNIDLHH